MTDRKTEKRILIFVMVFYVAISAFAVCILNLSGSIFAKRGEARLTDYLTGMFGAESAESIAGEADTSGKLEGLEALETDGQESAETYAEPKTEAAEPETTESEDTEAVPVEPQSEEASEPAEEHFYSFRTNNRDTILRMREAPGEDAGIIYELKPGSSGYVIELGDDWSKVSAYGHEGYCVNEYLTMTEITEEEYEKLREESDSAAPVQGTASGTSDTAQSAAASGIGVTQTVPAAPGSDTDIMTGFVGTAGQQPAEDP